MKYCKDCKFFRTYNSFDDSIVYCLHDPERSATSPVTGKSILTYRDPGLYRTQEKGCGPEAKFWEPKATFKLISFIKQIF